MDHAFFPSSSDIIIVLGVFLILLLCLDLLLVRWLKLSKKAWKRIDYVWLFFAALGLVGTSASVRTISASSELNRFNVRALSAYDSFYASIIDYGMESGYVCRNFVKSEYSPPEPEFSNVQKELDVACAWFRSIKKELPHAHMEQDKINFIKFPNTQPPLTNQSILEIISELHEQLDDYNNNVNEIQKLRSMNEQSEFERMLIYLGPWLLAFALALRITKVTGELKNES